MYITICGDFARIQVKYTAKWNMQTAEFFSNTLQIRKAVIRISGVFCLTAKTYCTRINRYHKLPRGIFTHSHFAYFSAFMEYLTRKFQEKKSCLQDSPTSAGCLERQLPFRRSAILPGRAFFCAYFTQILHPPVSLYTPLSAH